MAGPSRRYHDRVAHRYTPRWQFERELAYRFIRRFLPRQGGAPVLDVGCGTGYWGLKLLRSGFGVTFVDNSPKMLQVLQNKLADQPHRGRANVVLADICDLSCLEPGRFELAVAMGEVIGISSSPQRAVRQLWRVMKAGAVLVATGDHLLAGLDYFLEKGDLDGLERFCRTGRTVWLTRDRREQFELQYFSCGQFRRLFERIGFEVLDLQGLTVLGVGRFEQLLTDSATRRRLGRLEQRLGRLPESLGRASHLLIAVRKP